jgi:hypothetical protein
MKILITGVSIFLLLMTEVAFADDNDIMQYLENFHIRVIDRVNDDLKLVYNPVIEQIWKLQLDINLDMNRGPENQESAHTRPALNLGTIPEVLLKYQSNAVVQWGHPFRNSILLLRIGLKPEDLAHIDFRNKGDNAYGFNFLIDFWFNW